MWLLESTKYPIESIRRIIEGVKGALEKRGILNESSHLLYYFKELKHPTSELEQYLKGSGSRLDAQSAPIYVYFVRSKIKELQEIAAEIDNEYAQKVTDQ